MMREKFDADTIAKVDDLYRRANNKEMTLRQAVSKAGLQYVEFMLIALEGEEE